MIMVWHDCKIDPPKKSGGYLLWYKDDKVKTNKWDKVYYELGSNRWADGWGWTIFVPYKWAEVDFSGVE